jgi:hypothetical protein
MKKRKQTKKDLWVCIMGRRIYSIDASAVTLYMRVLCVRHKSKGIKIKRQEDSSVIW